MGYGCAPCSWTDPVWQHPLHPALSALLLLRQKARGYWGGGGRGYFNIIVILPISDSLNNTSQTEGKHLTFRLLESLAKRCVSEYRRGTNQTIEEQ